MARNRHNIGFMAVDTIAIHHGFGPWRQRFKGLTSEGSVAGESALQQRINALLELLDRGLALDLVTVDEKGGRGIHLQDLAGVFLIGCDLVEQRPIVQAGFDLVLAQARGLTATPQGR